MRRERTRIQHEYLVRGVARLRQQLPLRHLPHLEARAEPGDVVRTQHVKGFAMLQRIAHQRLHVVREPQFAVSRHASQGAEQLAAMDGEQRRAGAHCDDAARVRRLPAQAALPKIAKSAFAVLNKALDFIFLVDADNLPHFHHGDVMDGVALHAHDAALPVVFALKLIDDHFQPIVREAAELRQRPHHGRHRVVVQHPAQQRVVQLKKVLPHHHHRRDGAVGEAVRASQLVGD
mmetsp:Transcript_26433/g.47033  ORF Transcript_26433/g.47033 Transcript_26433/m.47033 type:complete len:233 (+) Transcript_26433:1513-2211(+)